MSSFKNVSKGLQEALTFANGDTSHAKVHEVLDGEIDASTTAKMAVAELDDTWIGDPRHMRTDDIDFFDLDS